MAENSTENPYIFWRRNGGRNQGSKVSIISDKSKYSNKRRTMESANSKNVSTFVWHITTKIMISSCSGLSYKGKQWFINKIGFLREQI